MRGKLEVTLLGAPEVRLDGNVVTEFRSSKAEALFYYLATTRQPHTRATLANLLWEEWDENGARVNLNKTLSNLRQVFGDYLSITRQTVAFNDESNHWIDVACFEEGALPESNVVTLSNAISLYRGEFLEGFHVDAAAFELWMALERTQWRESAMQALSRLIDYHESQGDLAEAITVVRRMLNLEPWREEAHRRLMRLLARTGQRSAALAQYEICKQALADELAVEPDRETLDLYYQIRAGQIQADAMRAVAVPVAVGSPPPSIPATTNIPPQSTPFLGRKAELALLQQRLADRNCRLLTLVGPGGIGKTRLALEVARRFADEKPAQGRFPHGIFLVSLASVTTPAGMVSAFAEATGFQPYSNVPIKQQILDFLRQKQMLLILDNVEHLLDDISLVAEILATAPGVVILATSRRALNLVEEWFHPVSGLSFPSEGRVVESADGYDAVDLFSQTARRASSDFSLSVEYNHVARICRLVEGMPLALELAAMWRRVLPSAQIAEEIERSLDILTTHYHGVPERHRSMRAVLEQTWQMLTPDEQEVLRRLAVFRGGFNQPASESVVGASLPVLATLVEKSLLYVSEQGRYQIHELLRQFAAEKLAEDPETELDLRHRYCLFYLDLLSKHGQGLIGTEQSATLSLISEEIDNIRAGWQWAVERGQIDRLESALDCLYNFFQIRSRYQEGEELFADLVTRLRQMDRADHPRLATVLGRGLARCGAFYQYLGDYEAADYHLMEALDAIQPLADQKETAFVLNLLGQVAVWRGQKEVGRTHLLKSLDLCRRINDKHGVISALHQLANLLYATFGEYGETKVLAEECLTISREVGRSDWIAHALDTLGFVTFARGEYEDSQRYYEEGYSRFEKIGDQHGMALTLGGLGMVNWAIGGERLLDAIAAFERSLILCRNIGHRGQVSGRLGGLARVLNELGEYEQALAHATEGLAIARSLGSPVYMSHNLYCLTETSCGMNNLPAARRYLREGLQVAFTAELLSNITIYLYYYGLILAKESRFAGIDREIRQQKQEDALVALAIAQHHPACWQLFKDRSTWLRDWIASDLSPEIVAAADERSRNQPLNALVRDILAA
jgi:predicted ATPase/DNA-binding SARP family transcriptional activator